MAGPCSVESERQILDAARAVREAGAAVLRAGAFKPRSSPYSFQGLGRAGLRLLARAREETGLLIVTEAMDAEGLDQVVEVADIVQIGARNMQNYSLLKHAGRAGKPVLLKRGLSATIQELLLSAEYILAEGNPHVILCERGVRGFDTVTRNLFDLSAIPVVHGLSHLPIVADPSHGTGHRDMVAPMARAAVAAGADGLLVEVHPTPDRALSDGAQSLYPEQFERVMRETRLIAEAIGRRVAEPAGARRELEVPAAARNAAPRPLQAQDGNAVVGRASRVYRSLVQPQRRLRAGDRQPDDRQRGEPREADSVGLGQALDAVLRSARRGDRDRWRARLDLHAEHGARPGDPHRRPERRPGLRLQHSVMAAGSAGRALRGEVPAEGERSAGREMDVVELIPTVPDLPFERAVVWLDREDALPRRLEILERSGATRTLTLSKLRANQPVSDKTFKFEVPAGVRVVDQ